MLIHLFTRLEILLKMVINIVRNCNYNYLVVVITHSLTPSLLIAHMRQVNTILYGMILYVVSRVKKKLNSLSNYCLGDMKI